MRSNRPISIPLSLVVTFCVWFAFLWTMQHAPVNRQQNEGDFGGSRSSGGLANQFATTVVQFFDNQDPREISEDNPAPEVNFEGQIVELMPLPRESRETLAPKLPEVYSNPALSSKDLFRSDVDLDGDNDLDMALLIRLSKSEAMGAVLEYIGEDRFAFAGKFYCELEAPEDFERCFQILRTGGGKLHILSRMPNVLVENADSANPEDRVPEEVFRGAPPIPGWRLLRLEGGKLIEKTRIRDAICPDGGQQGLRRGEESRSLVRPVGVTESDLMRFTTTCESTEICWLVRFDSTTGKYASEGDPGAGFCEDPAESKASGAETR